MTHRCRLGVHCWGVSGAWLQQAIRLEFYQSYTQIVHITGLVLLSNVCLVGLFLGPPVLITRLILIASAQFEEEPAAADPRLVAGVVAGYSVVVSSVVAWLVAVAIGGTDEPLELEVREQLCIAGGSPGSAQALTEQQVGAEAGLIEEAQALVAAEVALGAAVEEGDGMAIAAAELAVLDAERELEDAREDAMNAAEQAEWNQLDDQQPEIAVGADFDDEDQLDAQGVLGLTGTIFKVCERGGQCSTVHSGVVSAVQCTAQ